MSDDTEGPMTAEEKLAKIAAVYETLTPLKGGSHSSTHARYNLEGALIDLERIDGVDEPILNTIRRVIRQLGAIETILAC